MPPEILVVLTGIVIAAGAGIQQLIKATVNRRVKKMEEDAEQSLKDRELKRQQEIETMRQQTAKAQEDAEQAKAIGENLTNLTSAVLEMVKTHSKESHANREALTNNTQTVGDLSDSVDRVATAVFENTSATRATGTKADNVVQAVQELKDIMTKGVDRIIQLLDDNKADETEAELPKAS
jgi:methyl-accepting chemotaxis protein